MQTTFIIFQRKFISAITGFQPIPSADPQGVPLQATLNFGLPRILHLRTYSTAEAIAKGVLASVVKILAFLSLHRWYMVAWKSIFRMQFMIVCVFRTTHPQWTSEAQATEGPKDFPRELITKDQTKKEKGQVKKRWSLDLAPPQSKQVRGTVLCQTCSLSLVASLSRRASQQKKLCLGKEPLNHTREYHGTTFEWARIWFHVAETLKILDLEGVQSITSSEELGRTMLHLCISKRARDLAGGQAHRPFLITAEILAGRGRPN